MFEIGLMFYSTDIEKDIIKCIERFKERMGEDPVYIVAPIDNRETLAGLKIVYSKMITKNHFILTSRLKNE